MTERDLHSIAEAILNASSDAEVDRLYADSGLTLSEKEEVVELVQTAFRREAYAARLMTAWAERERAKGRPEAELTFRNFVRETGILRYDGLRVQ